MLRDVCPSWADFYPEAEPARQESPDGGTCAYDHAMVAELGCGYAHVFGCSNLWQV